ncbi:MAG: RNA methyltransferase [Planctomycetes bacterium]|nr:RNA methyltransferase [Planctomycetota bacterium]
MPLEFVASMADPRLAPYRDLRNANPTLVSGRFIAEGATLVERLLASRFPIESVLAEERFLEGLRLAELAAPVYVVPTGELSDVIGFKFHRGVIACGRRLPCPALADIVPPSRTAQPGVLVVAIDVHDPENVGALIRNGRALGASGVLLNNRCADPFSRRVLRTSMGTVLSLPIRVTSRIEEELRELQASYGVALVGTVLDRGATSLDEYRFRGAQALLFGSEGSGLPAEIAALCDQSLTIPMQPGVDSLNVAAAAGIILYAVLRSSSRETGR